MIFLAIIGIFGWFILPIILYLKFIEKLNYKYKNIDLEISYAWIIFIFQIALGVQIIYCLKY